MRPGPSGEGERDGIAVAYVYNPARAHKILPLLEGVSVVPIKTWRDLAAPRPSEKTVVMIDTFGRFGVLGLAASLRLRSPLVVRLRGDVFRGELERVRARGGLLRWARHLAGASLIKLCFKRARSVIFNSEHLAREMAPRAKGKPVEVVYNPYTPPRRGADGEALVESLGGGMRVATVTNMVYGSKVYPVMEALGSWVPDGLWEELDLRWVVCGGGHHLEELRGFVRERGLEDRVIVPGHVGGVASLYEWCDALVHLTRLDAFANTPMEAMAFGKPVITNKDSDGTREQVFDGENGFIVEDAASFVAALRAYAKDPALRRRHGQAGKLLVEERFSVAAQRGALQKVLRGLFSREPERQAPLLDGETP